MTNRELLLAELNQTPDALAGEVLNFLLFLKAKQAETEQSSSNQSTEEPQSLTPEQSTGQHLLEHLEKMGTWSGDDFEECLQLVYNTRGAIASSKETPVLAVETAAIQTKSLYRDYRH